MAEPATITSNDCRLMANRIEGFFEANGARLHRDSDVRAIIDRMRWLGEQLDLPRQPERSRSDKEQLLRAFTSSIQARDIVYSLETLENIPPEKLRHLSKQLDHTGAETGDTPGRDTFFELQIAGRLARSFASKVTLEEPDVVMDLPNPIGRMGFACKRPKTQARIKRAIGNAATQCRQHGLPSVVVIGLEAIVQQQQLDFANRESLDYLYRRRIIQCAHSQFQVADVALHSEVIAVILGCRYHGIVITDQRQVGFMYAEQYVGFKGLIVAEQLDLKSTMNQLFG